MHDGRISYSTRLFAQTTPPTGYYLGMMFVGKLKSFLIGFKIVKVIAMFRKSGTFGQLDFFTIPAIGDPRCRPWMNYGAVDFVDARTPRIARVLELGGGLSTTWWLNRGNSVTTIETDYKWAERINKAHSLDENFGGVRVVEDIAETSLGDSLGKFDVIVIDHTGDRAAIVPWVVEHLAEGGLIVFDNTDRRSYAPGLAKLRAEGFGYLSFFGMVPGLHFAAETTIFSRDLPPPHNPDAQRKVIFY